MRISLEIAVPDVEADRELLWGKALAIEKNVRAMLKVHYGPLYSVTARVESDDGEVLV